MPRKRPPAAPTAEDVVALYAGLTDSEKDRFAPLLDAHLAAEAGHPEVDAGRALEVLGDLKAQNKLVGELGCVTDVAQDIRRRPPRRQGQPDPEVKRRDDEVERLRGEGLTWGQVVNRMLRTHPELFPEAATGRPLTGADKRRVRAGLKEAQKARRKAKGRLSQG
jgi:hypothetical protein